MKTVVSTENGLSCFSSCDAKLTKVMSFGCILSDKMDGSHPVVSISAKLISAI